MSSAKWRPFCLGLNVLTCGDGVISVWLGQYHGCWCPGSLRRQDNSSHDIDYVEYVSPGLTWGRILSTCVISMWSNDLKYKYMFIFPLKNPKLISQLRGIPQPQYFVPSLLEPYWTYLWKHYISHKKDTKVGSQILATKFSFVLDWWWYHVQWSKSQTEQICPFHSEICFILVRKHPYRYLSTDL